MSSSPSARPNGKKQPGRRKADSDDGEEEEDGRVEGESILDAMLKRRRHRLWKRAASAASPKGKAWRTG